MLDAWQREKGVTMRKAAAFLGALVLAGLVLVPAAGAAPPYREFAPADDFVSHACGFAVAVHIVSDNEYFTFFADGSALLTGSDVEQLTNLSDPSKSIVFNVSGPGRFTPTEDGGFVLDARGHWLFFFGPGLLGPGSPGMIDYSNGPATLALDVTGHQTYTPARNTLDVCAVLA
jgi:hypothetical protein